ncbi:MAG: hypothetical protein GYA14_14155 [Ignavibacteria bacterium]|nr:hypothetical protein [Ignavibacteria bacterium]
MDRVLKNLKQKFLEGTKDKEDAEYDNIVDKYYDILKKYTIPELMEMMNIVLHSTRDETYKKDFKEMLEDYIMDYLIE